MSKEKAIIIIPTYNEEENIAHTIGMVLNQTENLEDFQVEILVFDSQSSDATAQIVKTITSTTSRVHFAEEPQKTGLGSAYLQAMRIAIDELNADIVFEFDADGSHKPCYIAPMLALLKDNDVVVGSRYISGGAMPTDWGVNRKILSKGGNWIARLFLTRQYKDLTSGMRATRTSLLKKVLPKAFLSNNYAYKLQLYWLLHQAKARIVEFPIVFIDREKGNSKLPKNSIVDSMRVLMILRLNPLKQYVTMCCVGSVGALIQFALYNGLRAVHYTPFFASQVAICAAIASNYTFNSRITFKRNSPVQVQKSAQISRFSQFLLYSIIMIYLQSAWVHYSVDYFGTGTMKENIILLVGIYLGSILNYFFYSTIIWPKHCR